MAEITGDQDLTITVDVLDDVAEQTRRLLAGAGYPRIRVLARDGLDGAKAAGLRPARPRRTCPRGRPVARLRCPSTHPTTGRNAAGRWERRFYRELLTLS
jgi:hypothetical protein